MWIVWLWFKEAIKGVFKNLTINLFAATLTFLSLFLLSFWLIVSDNIQFASDKIEENIQISVNLKDDIESYNEIQKDIEKIKGVRLVEFISKEEAYNEMEESLGDRKELLTELGFNPLPASFEVKVHEIDDVKLIANKIEALGVSKSIKYGENYVGQIFQATSGIRQAAYVVMILMIVSAGSMIFMSIRMNIISRNKELEIKDLIGAGKINTRVPFILEGLLLTMGSAGLMLGMIYLGYDKLVQQILTFYPGTSFVPSSEILASITPVLLIVSAVTGIISSFLSTQKYMKRH